VGAADTPAKMVGFFATNKQNFSLAFVSYFFGHIPPFGIHYGYHFSGISFYHDSQRQISICLHGAVYNCGDESEFADHPRCVANMYVQSQRSSSFVRDLKGDFAIVLFDFKQQTVIIATDVFGTKPLWVAVEGVHAGFSTHASTLRRLRFR
jgi:hypothetical protein